MNKMKQKVNNIDKLISSALVYTTKLEDMATLKYKNIQTVTGKHQINRILKQSKPIPTKKSILKKVLPEPKKRRAKSKESERRSKEVTIIFYYNDHVNCDIYVYNHLNGLISHLNKSVKEMEKLVKRCNSYSNCAFMFKICCWYSRHKTIDSLEGIFSMDLIYLRRKHECNTLHCTCCCKPNIIEINNETHRLTAINIMQNNIIDKDTSGQASLIIEEVLKRFEGLKLNSVNGIVTITADNDYLNKLTEFDEKILKQILIYAQSYVDQYKIADGGNKAVSAPNKAAEGTHLSPTLKSDLIGQKSNQPICEITNSFSDKDTHLLPTLKSDLIGQESNQPICQITNSFSVTDNISQNIKLPIIPAPNLTSALNDDIETTIPTSYIHKYKQNELIHSNNVVKSLQTVTPQVSEPRKTNMHLVNLLSSELVPPKNPIQKNYSPQVFPNLNSKINDPKTPLNKIFSNNDILNNELLSCVNDINSLLTVEIEDSDAEEEFILGF